MKARNAIDLDNPATYRSLDRQDMLKRISAFPSLCRQAWDMAVQFALPDNFSDIDKVVVLGMGGSAIGGDLVGALTLAESHVPVFVCRSYSLPAFVNDRTLVVASSYSGNTEETLACFEQSLNTMARKLAMTTGGKLKELADSRNIPVFSYNYKSQPRAALPFSFMPLLCFMKKLGFLRVQDSDIDEMFSALREQQDGIGENVPLANNEAKKIARDLQGRLAVIYGAEAVAEAAHRWKTQINENSKAWAFYEVFPEMNHNSVVGYEFPPEINNRVLVIMLASSFFTPRVQLRYEIVSRMLQKANIDFRTVHGCGKTRLSEMMSLVLLGDYISYYLALLNHTDPTPVRTIDYLKEKLAGK